MSLEEIITLNVDKVTMEMNILNVLSEINRVVESNEPEFSSQCFFTRD